MDVYSGKEPYIFVSYAHSDSKVVVPIIEKLQQAGFRLWYDKGIEAGTEWPQYIAERLAAASCVMVFMSPRSAQSHNCRNEINLASELKKEMFVVYLEEFELALGLRLLLNLSQAIYKNRSRSDAEFLAELTKARIIAPYRETAEAAPQQTAAPVRRGKKKSLLWAAAAGILLCLLIALLVFPRSEQTPDTPGHILTDYETFYEMLPVATQELGCDTLWDPTTLIDNIRVDQEEDGDVWQTYYTDHIALEDVSLHLGFRDGGEEIIAVLNDFRAEDIDAAYKLVECISSSVNGYYFTDFYEIMTNDDRVPWRKLDEDGRSIWNEVLQLEERAFSMTDPGTTVQTWYKSTVSDDLLIYVERRSRVYEGEERLDFTILYEYYPAT